MGSTSSPSPAAVGDAGSTAALSGQQLCSNYFAFECTETSCCASYHQRFLFLIFSLVVFAVAILIAVLWLALDFRPSRMSRRPSHEVRRALSDVEIKSCEEAKYLRRMSELNPGVRRESMQ